MSAILKTIVERDYKLNPQYTPTADRPYIVRIATAQMPSSCKGNYGKVAVIETDGQEPTMIRDGAQHVRRIVWCRDKLNVGRTTRSAFGEAVSAAIAECSRLNAIHG